MTNPNLKLKLMKKSLHYILLAFFVVFANNTMNAQCTNTTPFASAAAPTDNTPVQISTCNYQTEYSTISGVSAGETYSVDYDLGGCITVHSGTFNGPVVASGMAPLSWTAAVSGDHFIHYNTNCGCGTATSCGVSTITCTSCTGPAGPCTSISNIIGCGTAVSTSLSGTGVWNESICGWSTPGLEAIWSFTATASGVHSLDISSISGGFIDFSWQLASAGCSSTGWTCIDDISTTGNYGAMNWIAGETYYILLEPEGTGAYNVVFDVDCPNPGGPVVAGDCSSATPICTNVNFSIDPNGYGLVDEICTNCISNPSTNPGSANDGCLLSGELNSTWFLVNVAVGGNLEFSFGAAGGGNCYDWAMWPYDAAACAGIIGNTLPPVSCNYNFPCDSYTGIASTPPAGGDPGNFEPTLTVATNDQFVICFSNFSSAVTNVPLDFFGTADISCTPLPIEMIDFVGIDHIGYNELTWSTATEINNSHFEIQRSLDGISFTTIGTLEGAGTSLEQNDYRFVDYAPSETITYYRLKQIDFDGNHKMSEVIALAQTLNKEFKVVSAFPNPASTVFNVHFITPSKEMTEVQLLDLNGRVVYSSEIMSNEGINIIEIPVDSYNQGLYFVNIINEETHETESVKMTIK